MKKYRFALNLQLFAEDGEGAAPGVEGASAAGEQSQGTEVPADQTGVDTQAAAEPNRQEIAFAKRLAAERAKWEGETAEKYKNYDVYKANSEYFEQLNGVDALTLKERVELERLHDRAEQQKVSPETLKRIDELERKAARGDALEAEKQQQEEWKQFKSGLDEFAKDKTLGDKPLDSMELWNYMHENEIAKPEAAYKAMKADLLEPQLAKAKEDAVKEYLESKKAPRVEGAPGAAAQSIPQTGGGFKGAEQRAAARIRAARTAE